MKLPLSQSLRFRFPFVVFLGVTVPIVVGLTLASFSASKIIAEKTEETLNLQTKALSNTVNQWLEMNVLAIQNLSKQPDTIALTPEKQIPLLEQIQNSYEHIYIAHTVDLRGTNIARSDRKDPKNYSDRDWFKGAMANQDITFQPLVGRTNQKPAVCFAAPIRQGKSQVIAAVNMCSTLTTIADRVGATTIGNTGYAFVIDDKGQVVAHPDEAMNSGDSLVDLSNYPPVANLLADKQDIFTFKDGNTEWIAQGMRLDNGWGVIVLQEAREAFLMSENFKLLAVAIGLTTISTVGLITWLSVDRLIEPLQKMTRVANAMSQGDLTQKVSSDRNDEVGILASSLDTLAKQLQDAFTQLEIQYRESTEQQLINQKLSRQQQLQIRIQNLQEEIAPVNEGDLTARALVTDDEIGTIAGSYNQTLENLSQIILQVQDVTKTVAETTNLNEEEVSQLSIDALKQTEEVATALDQIQSMAGSMMLVAQNAANAETSIKNAAEKVKQGDRTINATAKRIFALQDSTDAAKEQVKKLGKASRKISKAIDLIRKIALQTNVLAVNASIEAARAGEDGMGFTVVAEEVQSLATRSAKTASDIEKLVLEIQAETGKVIKMMEKNSQEIVEGSQLMKETRLSLQQVTEASSEIDRLIEDINHVAAQQSQQSQTVTNTMEEVAAIATKTSTAATGVSTSFKDLLNIAEQLEASVNRFRVK